jgi:hypothetical protein
VIEQVPTDSRVAAFPETTQTFGVADAKVTASPELAVAVSEIGPPPNTAPLSAPKEIVCAPAATAKL